MISSDQQTIELGERITGSDIVNLAMQLGRFNDAYCILLDFRSVRFFELTPMSFLLGKIIGWKESGKIIYIQAPQNCRVWPYMQRMNFWSHCGMTYEDGFSRHPSIGRFREFSRIERGTGTWAVGRLSSAVADCVAPEQRNETDPEKTGFYDSIEYSVSELLLNTVQHSKGSGFLGAQFYPSTKQTQLAMADVGQGIRESFVSVDSPHTIRIKDDIDAINVALEGKVSSTSHRYPKGTGENPNSGVGLTVLTSIAEKIGGEYVVLSGEAAIVSGRAFSLGCGNGYKCTFCAFSLPRQDLERFYELRESVLKTFDDGEASDDFLGVFR